MADQTATYHIVIKDEATGAATSATAALRKLQDQIISGNQALAEMRKALRNLRGAAGDNVAEIAELQEKIKAQRGTLAEAQANFIKLGGVFRSQGPSEFQKRLGKLQDNVGKLSPQLAGLIGQFSQLQGLIAGGAMAAGMIAVAAGFAALVIGATAATVALYKYGVAQADARRSELLRLEGLAKAGSMPGFGVDMQNAIDAVAASTPVARAEVAKLAQSLKDSGLRGRELEDALRGLALKDVVGDAAGLMASLDVQIMKMKEAFDALFKDLKIDAFLDAWKQVTGMLSQSTASGRTLKFLLETLLQPLVDMATAAAPILKDFFLDIMIGLLELTIVLLDVRDAFVSTFGDTAIFKGLTDGEANAKRLKVALYGVASAMTALGVAVVVLAVKLWTFLVPAMWALVAPMLPFIAAAIGVGLAIGTLITYWDELKLAFEQVDWSQLARDVKQFAIAFGAVLIPAVMLFAPALLPIVGAIFGVVLAVLTLIDCWDDLKLAWDQFEWSQLGSDIIDGIVNGLRQSSIVGPMVKLAEMAYGAFQGAIDSHSPSKMFATLGATIPAGVAAGVEANSDVAADAASKMVAGTTGVASGLGGTTITVGEVHIHASSDKPEQLALDFRRELERVLAGFASELGAPEPA